MRISSNKKPVLLCVLAAMFFFVLSLFAVSVREGDKVTASASQSFYEIDATALSFAGKPSDVAKKDTGNFFQSGTNNNIIETSITKASPSVKVETSVYGDRIYGGDNDATRVEVKLLFNRWPDTGYGGVSDDATHMTLRVYNVADTDFENPIATVEEYETVGNFVRILQLSPEKVANNRGKLQGFVVRVESDATSWLTVVMIDYVKIVFDADGKAYGGECLDVQNPENIVDENVIWTEAKGYADTYIDLGDYGGFFSYVENPAMVELRKEKFPSVACVAESDGTETLLLKNVVFAFNVGNLSASDYEQFVMDILLADKRAYGGHELYLYGTSPERFVDEKGEPVGYAAKVVVESYEQGFHNRFLLEGEEVQKLADENGMISKIYVLYHGNTLDTENKTVGLRNGSQIWVNKIQFLVENEVEAPTLANNYNKYDLSELFPVGESVRLENKAAKSGDMISHASLKNVSLGELSFTVDMASGDNVAILLNAKGRSQVNEYLNGGILFYVSESKLEISAHVDGATTKSVSASPAIDFNGEQVVKLECVPYYLNTVESGMYCAIWVGEEKIVSEYIAHDYLSLGNALHLCYEAKNAAFETIVGSSKSEGFTSASELMNVKIQAEEIRYSLDRTDIPLSLSWYDTGVGEVSEISCESTVATVNQEVRRIVFTENGEAKVQYVITNAFGTFVSNELTLECADVVILPQIVEKTATEKGNNVGITALQILPIAAFVVVAAVLVIKKTKSAKKGE